MQLYWGDLHNHCGITYGFGSLENALAAAKEQLDFCAVIGHAMWPDIPEREPGLEFLVDFHLKGFAKLRSNWETVRESVKNANVPHEFVTFQGYEIHSSRYGDHHVLSPSDELPLIEARSPAELARLLEPYSVIAVPHHVGYTPGYRGINWDAFDPTISPVVEVYSKHGSSMSDHGVYPYYHSMGPRDSRNTIHYALRQGKRFGFIGSTDHHAGYPGSYGDGRVAVWAKEKTREAIWEALLARRTYAVTGDKIRCSFEVDGAQMGSEITGRGQRHIALDVTACDQIEKIVIYKNSVPWKVINGECMEQNNKTNRYKLRVEMGWGGSHEAFAWHGELRLKDGLLASVETCFRGQSVLAPTPEMRENPDINALNNKLISQSANGAEWTCTSFRNPSTLHPQTAALILEIEGDSNTRVGIRTNGITKEFTLGDLLTGSRSWHLQAHNSHAVLVHRAVPEYQYRFQGEWTDLDYRTGCDVYHAEIRQMNGQMAWISPVFVHY